MTALTHGHRGRTNADRTPTYRSWMAMIARCHYQPHPYYPIYGGRGIRVCDQWRGRGGFAGFLADLGTRPSGTTLDRIDPSGNYEPGNVRWASPITQRWNRRDMQAGTEAVSLDALVADTVDGWPF